MKSFLVISILLTSMAPFIWPNTDTYAQEDPLTVLPFKGVYSVGMTVTVFGEVTGSFNAGDDVSIKVANPNGDIYEDNSAELDDTGSYTFQFELDGELATVLGLHTVEATYQSLNANTSFEVKEKPILTISVDKTTYDIGDVVTISGKVEPRILDPVEIRIYGFNNTVWQFLSVSADKIRSDGTFKIVAGELIGKDVKAGKYRLDATYAERLATASLEFDVKVTGKAVVAGLMPVDQSGNPLDEIFTGQQVLLQADLRNNLDEKQPFAYIVLIKDSDGITVSLSWITGAIPSSETLTAAQSWVPDDPGSFSVEVFLWESVSNPVPLTGKVPRTDLIVQA